MLESVILLLFFLWYDSGILLQSPSDSELTVAQILLATAVSLTSVATQYGYGRHKEYLSTDQFSYILYLLAIIQPMAIFSFVLPKFAVMLLILELIGPRKQGVWILYMLLIVLTVFATLSATTRECSPKSPASAMI